MNPHPLSRRIVILYALPAAALAMPTIPVYVYLPSFYAETIGLGLATTGLVLLLSRIFDTVTDPVIGALSDRWQTRWGRRKPWIFVGAPIAGAALLALFNPPAEAGAGYLLVATTLLYGGWTMIMIPYTAWGAEITRDYHDRVRVTAAREGVMLLGIVLAGMVPALFGWLGMTEQQGLSAIAVLAVAAGCFTLPFLLTGVKESNPASRPTGFAPGWTMTELLRNRPFLRLLGAWFLNGLANGIPASLLPLYLRHVLQASPPMQGLAILLYFASAIAFIPIWTKKSRKIGKHRAWCVAMIAASAAFVWAAILSPGAWPIFLVICVVTGAALGADLALPPALQADVSDYHRLRHKHDRTGLLFALWSMATKLSLALAVGLSFPALEALGFRTGEANEGSALLALAVIYAALPAVLKLMATLLIWHHPITEKRHDVIRRRLRSRGQVA